MPMLREIKGFLWPQPIAKSWAVRSDFQVRVRPRILALLDLTVLGAFLVPSRQIEVESRVTAHLLDTRNGLIYHSTLRKEQSKGFLPMAWGKDAVERHRKELANENYKQVAEDL